MRECGFRQQIDRLSRLAGVAEISPEAHDRRHVVGIAVVEALVVGRGGGDSMYVNTKRQNLTGATALVHRRIHFVHAPVHQAFVDASTFQTSAVASVWVDALGREPWRDPTARGLRFGSGRRWCFLVMTQSTFSLDIGDAEGF